MFADFPTEYHSNWQWWDLVSKSGAMIMDKLPGDFRPTVQVIDTWFTNRKLGLVFEANVSGGKLVVCSIDLQNNLDQRPAARQFRHSLLNYMNSTNFAPKDTLSIKQLKPLFHERFPGKVVSVSSEANSNRGQMMIDVNPATVWHSSWEGQVANYPHEVTIKLEEPMAVKGLKLLPRQDMSNGWVKDIEIYLSDDGENWGSCIAAKSLSNGASWKQIQFDKEYQAGYIRIVMKSPQNAEHPWASLAEVKLVTEAN